MSTIQVGGQLQPGTVDTPLDVRSRVATLADVANIPVPYVGMPFYVKATGKLYVVKSLKSKQIGPVVTENAAIDEYEQVGSGSGGAASPEKLLLIRPIHGKPLWPVVYAYPDRNLTEADKVTICDGANYGNVSAWDGKIWGPVDGSGIPHFCKNLPVEVDTSTLQMPSGYFVYHWVDDAGYQSDAISMPFPAITEPTPFHLRAVCGDAAGMAVKLVTAAEYEALPEPDPATLYFVRGGGLMFNGEKYYPEPNEEVTQ